jgi:hypothetical protein
MTAKSDMIAARCAIDWYLCDALCQGRFEAMTYNLRSFALYVPKVLVHHAAGLYPKAAYLTVLQLSLMFDFSLEKFCEFGLKNSLAPFFEKRS